MLHNYLAGQSIYVYIFHPLFYLHVFKVKLRKLFFLSLQILPWWYRVVRKINNERPGGDMFSLISISSLFDWNGSACFLASSSRLASNTPNFSMVYKKWKLEKIGKVLRIAFKTPHSLLCMVYKKCICLLSHIIIKICLWLARLSMVYWK